MILVSFKLIHTWIFPGTFYIVLLICYFYQNCTISIIVFTIYFHLRTPNSNKLSFQNILAVFLFIFPEILGFIGQSHKNILLHFYWIFIIIIDCLKESSHIYNIIESLQRTWSTLFYCMTVILLFYCKTQEKLFLCLQKIPVLFAMVILKWFRYIIVLWMNFFPWHFSRLLTSAYILNN